MDFYHVSEYLSAVSELLGESKKALWFKHFIERISKGYCWQLECASKNLE